MDTATKTAKTVGMNAEKTAPNRVVQITVEATRDFIGNKTADRITSVEKPKK